MTIPSLLRRSEHAFLKGITLTGSVLDLGGDARSDYRTYCSGTFTSTILNFDNAAQPDIVHDLEEPLPIPKESYENVLMINVLEHIYNRTQLIQEAGRVLTPGGQVIAILPFLFPLHPSPKDFWRLSKAALEREFTEAGFVTISVTSLGSGVFSAVYVSIDRLMPSPIRFFSYYTFRYVALFLDVTIAKLSHYLHKKYDPNDYALGYAVHAFRP